MDTDLKSSEDERQRLEWITQNYAAYQGLGVTIAGVLSLAYGWIRLAGGLEPHGRWFLAAQLVVWCIMLLPRLFSRFYYRPKFGYVKPRSPAITDAQFWLMSAVGVLFFVVLMPFVFLPAMEHSDGLPFEPSILLLGIVFVAGGLFNLKKRSYQPYHWMALGLALVVVALLPAFHIQTQEQVRSGWYWITLGMFLIIFGWDGHRRLVRDLGHNQEQDHG